MREYRDWLRFIAAGEDAHTDSGITIHRITGGNNNAIYRVEADGLVAACKLCVADERRRATREYATLHTLHGAGLDLAPEPLWLDESCEIVSYPAVAYRWLSGEPLGASVTDEQLAAVLASVQLMHTLEPERNPQLADTWLHWFDFCRYLPELDEFIYQYGPWLETSDPEGRALVERLAQLRDNCKRLIAATRVNPGRAHIALRICRADTNLANAIWNDEGRVRWVDWEYSGWGDPALELAEMRWHAAMLGLSQTQHDYLRRCYERPRGDAGFDERLAVWDRIVTTRWCLIILRALWSAHNGPDRVRLSRLPADPAQPRAARPVHRARGATGHTL